MILELPKIEGFQLKKREKKKRQRTAKVTALWGEVIREFLPKTLPVQDPDPGQPPSVVACPLFIEKMPAQP